MIYLIDVILSDVILAGHSLIFTTLSKICEYKPTLPSTCINKCRLEHEMCCFVFALTHNRQPRYDCLLRQAVLLAPGKSLTLVPRLHALSWNTLNEPAEFSLLNSALTVFLNSAEFFPRKSNMIVDFHLISQGFEKPNTGCQETNEELCWRIRLKRSWH